jgi:hypothetical protein
LAAEIYTNRLIAVDDNYPNATAEHIRAMTNIEFTAHMEKLCRAKGIGRSGGECRGETWTGTWQDNDDENLPERV